MRVLNYLAAMHRIILRPFFWIWYVGPILIQGFFQLVLIGCRWIPLNIPWCFLEKKRFSKKGKSTRCYICNKKGHFAKDCPKNKKGAKMIRQIQQRSGVKITDEDDIESLFSIDDEPNDQSICAIQIFVSSDSEDSEFSLSESSLMIQPQKNCCSLSILSQEASVEATAPHIPVSICTSKYSKPVTVIAFIDTRAAESIMNPEILPREHWEPHTRYFSSASRKVFSIDLRSKPIKIQFFPTCSIITTVLGSKLPGKDLIVGFDLYLKAKQLRILPDGIRYKQMFKPYVPIPRLFTIDADKIQEVVEELKQRTCAESHSDFLKKCNHPLWKNSTFFIKLPFKKNEDINPTKASHIGMNPDHLKLAEQECQQLQTEGLIEASDSQ
ncbi:hypothetical protein V6Z12_D04G010900 [Gossypium hirsutum]